MSGKGGNRGERSGRVDVCTPEYLLEVVYEVLGGFPELDPASNPASIVKAEVHLVDPERDWGELPERFYAASGLAIGWADEGVGTAFVNPPYSRWDNPRWADKLQAEALQGVRVVGLVPAAPSCKWWDPYWRAEHLAFLPRVRHHGEERNADFEQALVAWNVEWFAWRDAVGSINGRIVR